MKNDSQGMAVDRHYLVFVFDSLTAEIKVLEPFDLSNTAYDIQFLAI